jgi:hypothetical protein
VLGDVMTSPASEKYTPIETQLPGEYGHCVRS